MLKKFLSHFLLFGFTFLNQTTAQSLVDSTTFSADTLVPVNQFVRDSSFAVIDTIAPVIFEPIYFSPVSASKYILKIMEDEGLWRTNGDKMKLSLSRLINHYNEPFDSVSGWLNRFPYDSVKLKPTDIVQKETIPIRWLNRSSFIIDTVVLEKDPIIKKQTIVLRVIDSFSLSKIDSIPNMRSQIESLLQAKDTITEFLVDYNYLKSKKIQIYQVNGYGTSPSLLSPGKKQLLWFSDDSSKITISTTIKALVPDKKSPFSIVPNERFPDSLKFAVETLIFHTMERDSMLIFFNDLAGRKTPLWMTTGREDIYRYWVKNSKNDSVTVWIGNPSKSNLTLVLEEEVNVERMERKMVDDIPFTTLKPQRTLAKVNPLKEIPIYWTRGFTSSYSLNQNHLSRYWARGGESSLTSMLDINGKAEYNNKEAKTKWINTGRIRYGTTWTNDYGFRTNTDIVEFNSQYNKVLREKIDFSSGLYMKTQTAKGYNYPNDSVPVSKFLNPGTFTISSGMEYKPNNNTSINFSPLSYRNTFVLDTAKINQAAHGIGKDKRVRHEMGGQLVIRNSTTILKGTEIKNSIRLFSSYLNKPQNVDVDWELSVEKQISWYFKIRLNLHLIYDDDILFPIVDDNKLPVLLPDGSQKIGSRAQFNQLLGLTLSFKI